MTQMAVRLGEASATEAPVCLGVTVVGAGAAGSVRVASLPKDQLYFWSAAWQALEGESEQDYENGDFETFETAPDAIAWLLSADDD